MSKRFGRNQRRRARERVAELERDTTYARLMLRERSVQLSEAVEANRNLLRALGELSVLNAPQIQPIVRDVLSVQAVPSWVRNPLDVSPDAAVTEAVRVVEYRLHDLTPDVLADLDGALHFCVPLGNPRRLRYRVTEQALRAGRATFENFIWPHISQEMLRMALHELYGEKT